jgi:hypothetical protein
MIQNGLEQLPVMIAGGAAKSLRRSQGREFCKEFAFALGRELAHPLERQPQSASDADCADQKQHDKHDQRDYHVSFAISAAATAVN